MPIKNRRRHTQARIQLCLWQANFRECRSWMTTTPTMRNRPLMQLPIIRIRPQVRRAVITHFGGRPYRRACIQTQKRGGSRKRRIDFPFSDTTSTAPTERIWLDDINVPKSPFPSVSLSICVLRFPSLAAAIVCRGRRAVIHTTGQR